MCAHIFQDDAGWLHEMRTNAELILHLIAVQSALIFFPGFHLHMIKCVLMHIALLGVMQYVAVSILCDILEENHWHAPTRGKWQARYNIQSQAAYA